MNTALAQAIDDLFADPNIGGDATYTPQGGAPVPVRVVARRGDAVTGFADARLWSETARFDVRSSEVATARPGDWIEVDGERFVVQGEPVRDGARLVWTVDTRPG